MTLRFTSRLCTVALVWLVLAVPVAAQNHYPLEITQPPANASAHRAGWAAPGKPYVVPVAVIGGTWPYTFTLNNPPAGMTIKNASASETCGIAEAGRVHVICGEITWAAPASGTFTVAVSVRDAAGATVARTFTVQVSAAPFKYVDAVNGHNASANGCASSCGDGSEGNPWKTLRDVWAASSGGQIVYFKTGQYSAADIPRFSMGGEGEGIEFTANKATAWLAFPGQSPVIDYGSGDGLLLQTWMWGGMVYVEGIAHQRGGAKYFHILGDAASGGVIRKNTFTGLVGDVSNAAFLMTPHNPVTSGLLIQDNVFQSATGQLAGRFYDTTKTLIEGNVMTGISNGLDPKDAATRLTFRANRLVNFPASRWGSFGMSGSFNNGSHVDFHHNLLMNFVDSALDIGATWTQPCNTPASYYYNNTFVGRIFVSRICAPTLQVFTRNVIVNGDGGASPLAFFSVPPGFSAPDWTRVQATNNLTGASGLVDANGQLMASARTQWLGQRGYELGGGTGDPPIVSACGDGQDNDGDGLIDLADPGCSSATDDDETNTTQPPQPTPCVFTIAPTSATSAAAGSTGTVNVTIAPSGCSPSTWTASSAVPWLTVTTTGTSVSYSVGQNTATTSRTGTLTVAGQTFTVTQAGAVVTPPTGCLNGTTTVPTGDVLVEQMSDGNSAQRTAIAVRVAALQRAGFAVELTAKSTYTTIYATCR